VIQIEPKSDAPKIGNSNLRATAVEQLSIHINREFRLILSDRSCTWSTGDREDQQKLLLSFQIIDHLIFLTLKLTARVIQKIC